MNGIVSSTSWLDETDSSSTPSERTMKKIDELNVYSSTRWDVREITISIDDFLYTSISSSSQCVLQYLVSPDRGQITRDTIDVFLHAKLLKKYGFVSPVLIEKFSSRNEDTASTSTDPYTITGAGFKFLLMNRRSQVWSFIINSLETRQVNSQPIDSRTIRNSFRIF